MKRSEQKAKIEELYRQIEELKNVNIEEDGVWKPENDEDYWFISSYAELYRVEWTDYSSDKDRLSIGNVFRTEEEAESQIEKLKVLAELKKFSCEFKVDNKNYYLFYECLNGLLYFTYDNYHKRSDIYFESEEKVNEAIEAVGEDRIKKYLFGVE